MSRTQREGQEQYPLKRQLQLLEQDWNSYKESIPRHRRRSRSLSPVSNGGDDGFLGLGLRLPDDSPKKLLSSLQQCHSPPPQRRSRICEARRSLLEALESAKDADASPARSSACSSLLIQEEGPSCSCLSFDAASGSSSSSSLASLCRAGEAEGKERRISGEERWVVRVILLGVVVWTVALGFILAMAELGAEGGHGEYVTPT